MEPAMKQRLLGAAVIIGLAVIVLPLILDGSGTTKIDEIPPPPQPQIAPTGPIVGDTRVPQAPPVEVQPAPAAEAPAPAPIVMRPKEPPAPELPASEPPPAQPPQPQARAEAAQRPPLPPAAEPPAPPPEPAAAAQPGWVVQVGSFSGPDKAQALRERLQAAGFEGFTDTFTGDGKTLYRVRVGPLPERAAAERLQRRIKAEQKLDGYVTQQR